MAEIDGEVTAGTEGTEAVDDATNNEAVAEVADDAGASLTVSELTESTEPLSADALRYPFFSTIYTIN